jgi:nitrite reductase/ring-hydroxylating ferredoxin subunit
VLAKGALTGIDERCAHQRCSESLMRLVDRVSVTGEALAVDLMLVLSANATQTK